MALNAKVALLLFGLIAGAAVGYATRPDVAAIRLGGTTLSIENNQVSVGSGTADGQARHLLLYTLAGGILGLLAGFALDRRR